jgi:hypothetical protein
MVKICVFFAVRTELLNIAYDELRGLKGQTRIRHGKSKLRRVKTESTRRD